MRWRSTLLRRFKTLGSPNCSRRRKRAEGPSSGSSQNSQCASAWFEKTHVCPFLREETTTLLTFVVTSADTPWFSHGFVFSKVPCMVAPWAQGSRTAHFLWEAALSHLVLHRLQVTKGRHEVSSRTCHAFDVLYSFQTRACPHQAGPVTGETWRKVRGEKSWTHHSLLSNCPELDENVMCVLFHGVIQMIKNHSPSKHGLLWELQMAVALFGWQLKKQLASLSMRTPMNYQWVLGPLQSILSFW